MGARPKPGLFFLIVGLAAIGVGIYGFWYAFRWERIDYEGLLPGVGFGLPGIVLSAWVIYDRWLVERIPRLAPALVYGFLGLWSVGAAAGVYARFVTRRDDTLELNIIVVIAVAAGALGWRLTPLLPVGAWLAAACGVAMIVKPYVLPVLDDDEGTLTPFPTTSETHLYWIATGAALFGLGLILGAPLLKKAAEPPAGGPPA